MIELELVTIFVGAPVKECPYTVRVFEAVDPGVN